MIMYTYKGVDRQTDDKEITLATMGKYLEDDITIKAEGGGGGSDWDIWGRNQKLIATHELHYTKADLPNWDSAISAGSTTAASLGLTPESWEPDITVDIREHDIVAVQDIACIPTYQAGYNYRGTKGAFLGHFMQRAIVDYAKEQDLWNTGGVTKQNYYPSTNLNGTFITIETIYNYNTAYTPRMYQTNSTASYGIYPSAPATNFSALTNVSTGVYKLGYSYAGCAITCRAHNTYSVKATVQKIDNVDIYVRTRVYTVDKGTSFATKTNHGIESIIDEHPIA